MLIGIDASRAVTEQKTGTEAYAHFLLQHLLPLAQEAGHEVRLYFNEADRAVADTLVERYPGEGVTIVNLPFKRFWTHVRLARELALNRPDIFFTPAHVIPASFHGPSIATVHDLGFHFFPEAHPPNQRRYLQWSTRHNARRSRKVIADSQATKRDLQRIYDIDPAKIAVAYPGPTPDLQAADQRTVMTVKRKYGIRGDYFLFIGTIQPRKNLSRLIQAYDQYFGRAEGKVHKLVIAGKQGWQAEPITATLLSLTFPNYTGIIMPGYIAEEDKAALICGATALLYPSLYEGFGFPVIEAQALGTPVLTANSSSLPEIAGPDGALFVDPAAKDEILAGMIRLIDDTALRERLRAAGLRNSQRFAWPKTAAAVLALLEEAAGESSN